MRSEWIDTHRVRAWSIPLFVVVGGKMGRCLEKQGRMEALGAMGEVNESHAHTETP